MTRLEVMGILVALVVCVGLFAWVFWSNLIAREKVPPRLLLEDHPSRAGLVQPVEPGDLIYRPGVGTTLHLTAQGREALRKFAAPSDESWSAWGLSPLTGQPRRLHIWSPPGENFDFDWSTRPPAPRLFDQFNPRPWAHG